MGPFMRHVRALCCLLTLMSKNFALSPAFIDEMVEGNEWIKSMVDGIEREKKKDKNENAREDTRRTTKRNKRKAVNVETCLTGQ